MISNELLKAYNETSYFVQSQSGKISIRIGNEHPTIDMLLAGHGIESWAFITAWNPSSNILEEKENLERQERLKEIIADEGLSYIEGAGVGDDGIWPPEPSLFIPGISMSEAKKLGKEFEQNAIVFGSKGGKAELIDCTSEQLTE